MSEAWRTILVGVDGSPESLRAAETGARVAGLAGAPCRLVHAAPDYWSAVSVPELGLDVAELDQATEQHARTTVTAALAAGTIPPALLDAMEVHVGRPAVILAEAAQRHDAELLVLGGKHHRGFDRITSSTVIHMVRAHDIAVLATNGGSPDIRRILVAVDLSQAAAPTLAAAERWAALTGAQVRALSVVEPMPVVPGVTLPMDDDEVFRASERLLELSVWPHVSRPDVETVVRRGRSAAAIVDEATRWHADLIIVGSHGRGWVDRLLIGSTSERLLHVLPTMTLVVPVGHLGPAGLAPAPGGQMAAAAGKK